MLLVACRPASDSASNATVVRADSPPANTAAAAAADSIFHVPDSARTFVYECKNGLSFTVRVLPESAWVYLPGRTVSLPHMVSENGARYSDGRTTYWSKGEEALLEENGRAHSGCPNNPMRAVWEQARLNGVDFRAVGQEPGWLLEIEDGEQVTLLADYGEKRVVTPAPPAEVNQAGGEKNYRIQTEAHRLTIVTRNEPCADTMSGERFPTTVVVTLDGKEYRGCGRAL